MSNYLFYTLLGYAAGLATAVYIDLIIAKRTQARDEDAKTKETK